MDVLYNALPVSVDDVVASPGTVSIRATTAWMGWK